MTMKKVYYLLALIFTGIAIYWVIAAASQFDTDGFGGFGLVGAFYFLAFSLITALVFILLAIIQKKKQAGDLESKPRKIVGPLLYLLAGWLMIIGPLRLFSVNLTAFGTINSVIKWGLIFIGIVLAIHGLVDIARAISSRILEKRK